MKIIKVGKNDNDIRLDNFLSKLFPNLKKSFLYQSLRKNKIKINGCKKPFNYRIKENDEIKLFFNDDQIIKKANKTIQTKIDFKIVYEDANIMIVNKPVGLFVHPNSIDDTNTLIDQIKSYLITKHEYNPDNENVFTPSLVNRLDRNTCGLILVAKNHDSLRILNQKIKNREIVKHYVCQVYGIIDPKSATICSYLTKDPKNNIVKITKKPISLKSKKIITKYKMISHDKSTSIVDVNLITGRTHQIRAHFKYIGFPLVGDRKYNNKNSKSLIKKHSHQHLCAYYLKFKFKTNSGILNYLNEKSFSIDFKQYL